MNKKLLLVAVLFTGFSLNAAQGGMPDLAQLMQGGVQNFAEMIAQVQAHVQQNAARQEGGEEATPNKDEHGRDIPLQVGPVKRGLFLGDNQGEQ